MFNYGKKIMFLRKKRNMTVGQLSKAIGVTSGQVSKIENGKSMPSVQILDDIIKYFGISYSDFFDDGSSFIEVPVISENRTEHTRTEHTPGNTNAKITTDEMDMIVAYRKASEAERTAINALLGQYKSTDNLGSKYA